MARRKMEAPEMRAVLPRVESLPQDASKVACVYARELHSPRLGEALEAFLRQAPDIPGLDGIGLGISQQPGPTFIVYALADLSQLFTKGSPVQRTATTVSEAFIPVHIALSETQPAIDPTLQLVNTHGIDLANLGAQLEAGELEDAFDILELDTPALDSFCIAAVAR